jgi:hypothetical protein
MRQNIQTRSQNFNQEIQEEYARTQQGGYCYKNPFRNVQRCIQNSMERVQELQAQMQHFNQVDAQRAAEFDAKATEYSKLEKEGRDYVAVQNGDPVSQNDAPVDYTKPTPRADDGYTFNYQGYGQQQNQQYQPQQQQQQGYQQNGYSYQQQQQGVFNQQNPYGQQQANPYQQSYMGQQNYGGQFNVGANFGANAGSPYGYSGQQQQYGNPYQQQGQQQGQGYWSSPYQAYGNYNMYGAGYR